MPRTSGILLHVTSLPAPFGIGDLGPAAYRFVDLLSRTGQGIWQVLPLGPTGSGDSPYQCFSAFAGNPLLVSLERLASEQLLTELDLASAAKFPDDNVEYTAVDQWHDQMLRRSFARFAELTGTRPNDEYCQFCEQNRDWLDGFATFTAIRAACNGSSWSDWEPALVQTRPEAIERWSKAVAQEIAFIKYVQFQFFRQWSALKAYANQSGVRIFGDVPIFVAYDSADVWLHQDLFDLDATGAPIAVAGVPPDYFSETGQLWGTPLYRWEAMAKDGYSWWAQRLRHAFRLFDMVRLDHFRGFEAFWAVPAQETTAIHGQWERGPGAALFTKLKSELGNLPIVAEDLGVITPEVEALRDQFAFAGMRVLQFAFGNDPRGWIHQPHHHITNCVAYTGTHDNDTAAGWFHSAPGRGSTRSLKQIEQERALALKYLASDGHEIHWDLIRAAWSSVAATAVAPLQDLLGLGSEARMNTPGTSCGNWRWRVRQQQLTPEVERRLSELTSLFDRNAPAELASPER